MIYVKLLKEISEKLNPMNGLVLDLRNDPGGLLTQAIEVSDVFLKIRNYCFHARTSKKHGDKSNGQK